MVKVYILGASGMLGSQVYGYFSKLKDFQVFWSTRNKGRPNSDSENDSYYEVDVLQEDLFELDNGIDKVDYIINCVGVIKPFMKNNLENAIRINSLFPIELANFCEKNNVKLIHITTDCVFSGRNGQRSEDDPHDCLDEYGKTKSLGEPKNCMTIRTSIIGEEVDNNVSLIEWCKKQKDSTCNGFTNHLWNGITTLQYAKVCEQIIREDLYEMGLFHVFSNTVNKFDLLEIISDRFNLAIDINPLDTQAPCDRTLTSNKNLCKKLNIPSIKEQISKI